MDTFTAIVLVGLTVVCVTFLILGFFADGRKIAEITDKRRNQAWAAQAEIEDHDLPEMVAAANEYRRRHGVPETTVDEVKTKVGREQLDLLDQAEHEVRRADSPTRRARKSARERRGF